MGKESITWIVGRQDINPQLNADYVVVEYEVEIPTNKEETHPLKILQRIFSFMENFHLRSCGTIFATLSTPNTNIYEGGEGSMAKTRQDSTTTTLC